MKSTTLAASTVVAVTLLISPYWVGVQAEQRFQDGVVRLDASLDSVSVRTRDYQRGWFTSRASTEIAPRAVRVNQVAAVEPPVPVETLTLSHVITHGPIPLDWIDGEWFLPPVVAHIRTLLEGSAQLQASLAAQRPGDGPPLSIHSEARIDGVAQIAKYLGGQAPLSIDTQVHYDGSGESRVVIPAFGGPAVENGETVDWKGLDGTVQFEPGLQKGTLKALAPLLSVVSEGQSSLMEQIGLSGDFELAASGLWVGSYELSLGKLQVTDAETGGEPVEINGLGFLTSMLPEGENMAVRTRFQFKEIRVPAAMAQAYGGPDSVGGALDLTLSGLDTPAMLNLQKVSEAGAGQDPEMATIQSMAALQQLLVASIAHSPELKIPELYLALPQGRLEASASARLDSRLPIDMSNPAGLLPALSVNIEAQAPITLVRYLVATQRRPAIEQARAQGVIELKDEEMEAFIKQDVALRIKEFIDQGWVVLEDGVLRARLQLDQGNVLVNGKPSDLAAFLP